MARPKVIVNCVASHYQGPNERIIGFLFDKHGKNGMPLGGLISFTEHEGGRVAVHLYRVSKEVAVTVSKDGNNE